MLRRFKSLCYNVIMHLNKDGSVDKRFKKNQNTRTTQFLDEQEAKEEVRNDTYYEEKPFNDPFPTVEPTDPNELHAKLLKDNNLKLDFDVLSGTIATKHGIIKLEKDTLVIKASYVTTK